MKPLAVGLVLRNRAVLVVGAGPVALGKIERLLAASARVTVVAPFAVPQVHALATAGLVQLHLREFAPADLTGQWFCLTATGRDRVDLDVFAACEARQILCNAADVPEACSVVLMAQQDEAPLTVAIGTRGVAPGLARRLQVEARAGLPADVAKLIQRYAKLRRWLMRRYPGQDLQPVRSATLRWLAGLPWAELRRPLPDLQTDLVADLEARRA